MNSQVEVDPTLTAEGGRLAFGHPLRLGGAGGELTVVEGRVWLTRRGEPDDFVLMPGERVLLNPSHGAVIEAWDAGRAAVVRWQPRGQGLVVLALTEGLRGLAFLAVRAAAGFEALARKAAATASRAQGCINAGDSIASCGALK